MCVCVCVKNNFSFFIYFNLLQQDETEEDTESERENMQNTSVSIGRTSFGRSIMHELNERSLFNKKVCISKERQSNEKNVEKKLNRWSNNSRIFSRCTQRSIEPDPDSSTSDISVLDEMDQYLDECLEMQEEEIDAREEGPTPPKVNKSGKSPLYNFKYDLLISTWGKKKKKKFASQKFAFSGRLIFTFALRSPLKIVSPVSSPKKTDSCVEDGGRRVPLVRTVSAYRRQQSEVSWSI